MGEALDPAGMVVTATYSDGSTAAVTGYTTSGFNSSTAMASQPITVSYTEDNVTKTTTFTVRIVQTGSNTITLYWVNEQGDLTFSNDTTTTVSQTGTLTIAAQGTGYTGQSWFINGIEDAANAGQSSYTFSGDKEPGKYAIGLRATKGGAYYHATLTVTVTAPVAQ
jgi:hypothetical protein